MGNGASMAQQQVSKVTGAAQLLPAPPPNADETRLRQCARLTAHCLDGEDDVHVTRFLLAGSAFVAFVESLGGFAAHTAGEIKGNLTAILNQSRGASHMRDLLHKEKASGKHDDVHGAESRRDITAPYADDSAAMGVFWVVLSMRYWECVCIERRNLAAANYTATSLRQSLENGTERVLRKHMGGIGFSAVQTLAVNCAPEWEELRAMIVAPGGVDAEFVAVRRFWFRSSDLWVYCPHSRRTPALR